MSRPEELSSLWEDWEPDDDLPDGFEFVEKTELTLEYPAYDAEGLIYYYIFLHNGNHYRVTVHFNSWDYDIVDWDSWCRVEKKQIIKERWMPI